MEISFCRRVAMYLFSDAVSTLVEKLLRVASEGLARLGCNLKCRSGPRDLAQVIYSCPLGL